MALYGSRFCAPCEHHPVNLSISSRVTVPRRVLARFYRTDHELDWDLKGLSLGQIGIEVRLASTYFSYVAEISFRVLANR